MFLEKLMKIHHDPVYHKQDENHYLLKLRNDPNHKKPTVIGSIHCNRMNYPKTLSFFHSNDALPKRNDAKYEIKETLNKDILGRKSTEWKPSILLDRKYNDSLKLFKVN